MRVSWFGGISIAFRLTFFVWPCKVLSLSSRDPGTFLRPDVDGGDVGD